MTAVPAYVDRIERALALASPADIAAGRLWYGEARAIAERGAEAYGTDLDHAAVALAHLSPRTSWAANVAAFKRLTEGDGERDAAIPMANYLRAKTSLLAADPWQTFGVKANKTRSFARNITGDPDAVTVDSHIARLVGISRPTEVPFKQPKVYADVADSYRYVSQQHGVYTPAEVQAITWLTQRDGRAA
jgi:hypothetical protein